MSKSPKTSATIKFEPVIWRLVQRLRDTGAYGSTDTTVIRHLVLCHLRQIVGSGELDRMERAVRDAKGDLYDILVASDRVRGDTVHGD